MTDETITSRARRARRGPTGRDALDWDGDDVPSPSHRAERSWSARIERWLAPRSSSLDRGSPDDRSRDEIAVPERTPRRRP
jgi:hypothetical protein